MVKGSAGTGLLAWVGAAIAARPRRRPLGRLEIRSAGYSLFLENTPLGFVAALGDRGRAHTAIALRRQDLEAIRNWIDSHVN